MIPAGGTRLPAPIAEPVFVLCAGRSGSTLLRFMLDAHPGLACPPETRLPTMCAQLASVWSQLGGVPLPKERVSGAPPIPDPALAGIRHTMNLMIGEYLERRGKRRYCDKSLGTAEHVDLLLRVFPGAKFLCLYRHPMDVIASGIEACPWGLSGFGFDAYADNSPRNSVQALAQFWADNAALILATEEHHGDCTYRLRYEDLVADPQGVSDGMFRFLGLPPVPGLAEVCFSADRERDGPSDYKIWYTSRITADSVGRGWSIPAAMIGPGLTATVNDLAGKLAYTPVGKDWGIAAAPPDLRRAGSGPTTGPVAGQAEAGSDQQPPPGLRLVAARLLSGLGGIDARFGQKWAPCAGETFLLTVTADHGAVAGRWRVDLGSRNVTSAGELAGGETGGARWDVTGPIEVWEQVLDDRINLSVASRRRLLRYCDTGEADAAMPGLRLGMLADLLSITDWQPPTVAAAAPARPQRPAPQAAPARPPGAVPVPGPARPAGLPQRQPARGVPAAAAPEVSPTALPAGWGAAPRASATVIRVSASGPAENGREPAEPPATSTMPPARTAPGTKPA